MLCQCLLYRKMTQSYIFLSYLSPIMFYPKIGYSSCAVQYDLIVIFLFKHTYKRSLSIRRILSVCVCVCVCLCVSVSVCVFVLGSGIHRHSALFIE